MLRVRCGGEKCGATYPGSAAFCPRCGKANDHQQPATPAVRPRRPFRSLPVIIGLVIVLLLSKGVFRPRAVPVPPMPVSSSGQSDGIDNDVSAALASLEAFSDARRSCAGSKSEKNRFAGLVTGRRVRWTGILRSSWRPGSFILVGGEPRTNASIRMMPATAEAREQVRQIPVNTTVEIEGVLMDDQWLHLLSVRVVE
jgi:hypothetical protein